MHPAQKGCFTLPPAASLSLPPAMQVKHPATMPGTHVLLAALLLCAAGTARAAISGADAKAFCSYVNDGALAGGWQTAEAVPAEVEEAVLKAFLASDAVNATTLRSILECMDEPLISSEGCSQVRL